MSKPATPAPAPASPPRPADPDFVRLCHQIRQTLADDTLTVRHQENLIIAVAQEYAAAMIEKHARPSAWSLT